MPRTCLLLILFVLSASSTCLPQRMNVPRPARLRVDVTYDGQTKVRDASVELMDAVGFSSAMDNKLTDQDGRVEFITRTGMHRIRISGADFYPFESEIDLVEAFHLEHVRVRRKPDGQTSTPAPEGQSVVPSIRLKVPDPARKQFEMGAKALNAQKWESSRKFFQAAVDLYPDYDLAYNGLGAACWQMNDMPAARAALLKATQLNNRFAEAQRNLARVLLSERNYEEVASLLNLSLNVDPMNAWALTNAAHAELQLRRFKEAAEHALLVHGMPHEGLASAHMIAGYALEAMGQKESAAGEFKLYLKEDAKGPNVKRAQEAVARLASLPPS